MADQITPKQSWIQPKLIVFGDVNSLTAVVFKTYGSSDGFTFNGQPIGISH